MNESTDLGSFPDRLGVLAILLHERQNTAGNNAVRLAEVMVDLFEALNELASDKILTGGNSRVREFGLLGTYPAVLR